MGTDKEPKAKAKIERGPTAERVAANVKQLREERRLSLEALSQRMTELGRPILRTGIAKIESGERRVDVDDLMALAIALAVTPNRLLLTRPVTDSRIGLTSGFEWPDAWAWVWASGELPRTAEGHLRVPGGDSWTSGSGSDWLAENRPHRLPVHLSMRDDWDAVEVFMRRFRTLKMEIAEAGYDPRILEDSLVLDPEVRAHADKQAADEMASQLWPDDEPGAKS